MINEKMREEFEAWFASSGMAKFKETAWAAWQASRAAIEVELPDAGIEDCLKEWPERGEKYDYDTFDTGYLYSCKKHEEVIEFLGLKVKP